MSIAIAPQGHYAIVGGPSFERIWDAVRYSRDQLGARIPVKFTTGDGSNLLCLKVDSATRVEGTSGTGLPMVIAGRLDNGAVFSGYYDAHTRSGFIDIQSS